MKQQPAKFLTSKVWTFSCTEIGCITCIAYHICSQLIAVMKHIFWKSKSHLDIFTNVRSPGLGLSLFWSILIWWPMGKYLTLNSTIRKIFNIIFNNNEWMLLSGTWPVKYGRKLSACTRVAKSMNPETFNDVFLSVQNSSIGDLVPYLLAWSVRYH